MIFFRFLGNTFKTTASFFSRFLLWLIGWKLESTIPKGIKKYVLIGASHTSYWDFLLFCLCRYPIGLKKIRGLAKKELFNNQIFALVLKMFGFVPIDRNKNKNTVGLTIDLLNSYEQIAFLISPEGTRSKQKKWRTGFYHIALDSKIPIIMAYADYRKKKIGICDVFEPTGDIAKDLEYIKKQYESYVPYHPKFSALYQGITKKQNIFHYPKLFYRTLLTCILFLCLFHNNVLIYTGEQVYGQLKVLWRTESIDNYLEKLDDPKPYREKINIIGEIKKFSTETLGLAPSGSYEKVYDQKNKPIMRVITAAPPYQLKAKTWYFPFLGSFSYKGFFNEKRLKKTKKSLKKQGYETIIQNTSAWSTLGFLNDPILSQMLNYSVPSLANTILHELTHNTIFVYDNLAYNENLASFIGYHGALLFLKTKYSDTSEIYLQYLYKKEDRKLFNRYLNTSVKSLDSLYRTFSDITLESQKAELKNSFITKIIEKYRDIKFKTPTYVHYFDNFIPNNAFFIAFKNYNEKQNIFERRYKDEFNSNLGKFITHLKKENPSFF